jgi:hypothetical protein
MRYQNRNLAYVVSAAVTPPSDLTSVRRRLPICAPEGKHLPGSPEFCTLEAFRERVQELTPTDWEVECSPGGASAT